MPKMLVEIIGENVTNKRVVPDFGNKILLKRGSKGRGRGDYYATYSNNAVEHYYRGFGPLKWLSRKVRIIEGADKCIEIHREGEGTVKTVKVVTPQHDTETIGRLFDVNVLKNSGAINPQLKVPTMLYIMLMLGFMLHFIVILITSGRLKL